MLEGLHLQFEDRVPFLIRKSAISRMSHLHYEERKCAAPGGSHLQYEQKVVQCSSVLIHGCKT